MRRFPKRRPSRIFIYPQHFLDSRTWPKSPKTRISKKIEHLIKNSELTKNKNNKYIVQGREHIYMSWFGGKQKITQTMLASGKRVVVSYP